MASDPDPLVLLRHARRLRNDVERATFEQALDLLADRMAPADLPQLLRAFDDEAEEDDLAWGLVQLVEDYDTGRLAEAFIEALPEMLPVAGSWVSLLTIRQLNDAEARARLIEAARAADRPNLHALKGILVELTAEHGSEAADALATRAGQALAALREA